MENFRKKTIPGLRDHKIEKLHTDKAVNFDDKFKRFFDASVAAYENSMFKLMSADDDDVNIEKILNTLTNGAIKKLILKYI